MDHLELMERLLRAAKEEKVTVIYAGEGEGAVVVVVVG